MALIYGAPNFFCKAEVTRHAIESQIGRFTETGFKKNPFPTAALYSSVRPSKDAIVLPCFAFAARRLQRRSAASADGRRAL